MKVDNYNKEKYTKKILNILFRKFILNWLGDYPNYFSFNPANAVSDYSRHKMDMIKNYIKSMTSENYNLETVFIEIKNFIYFEEFLNYLSPSKFYSPEDTLLYLLRHYKKINIRYNPEYDTYKFSFPGEYNISSSGKQQLYDLSIFFRSYTEILLDVKRESHDLKKLYEWLLDAEIDYRFAKNYDLFRIFYEEKGYSVEEILKLLDSKGLKVSKDIYFKQIKKDYNRFFRIIDNYYGLNSWDPKTNFKVHIGLFDKFYQEKNLDKINELGSKVLDLLPKSGLREREKNQISNLISKALERGKRNNE